MACLCNLQAAQILNEIDTERLFSNLPEIYVANRQFWAEHVFPMLKNARSARAPLDPTSLRDGFLKVRRGPLLIHSVMYLQYL
jgi:pleckstrin domain-containing family G protein 5